MKYNTELQREAKKEVNKMKKQNAKLRNNSKFGKLIENPVKKVDLKVVATLGHLHHSLKVKINFVMKQYQEKKKSVEQALINQFIYKQAC